MLTRSLRRAVRILHSNPHARCVSSKVLRTFKLADIGEGITECEVIRWAVAPQSSVGIFDPLCEVQSDKASVEITSPFEGIVKELLVKEGEVARVGQGLCQIEVEEEAQEERSLTGDDAPRNNEESVAKTEAQHNSLDESVEAQTPRTLPPQQAARRPHPLDPTQQSEKPKSSAEVLAPPSVRHYARSRGVDLAYLVPGSGKDGRIEKADVDSYLSASAPSPTSVSYDGQDITVELGRTRNAMWKAMIKSLEIPTFGYSTSLDITELHALLQVLNLHIPAHFLPASDTKSKFDPANALGVAVPTTPDIPETGRFTRMTYLPFLLKTLARTMMDWPLFRASITPNAAKPSLTIRSHADIALALATPTGLYTPLLRAADTQSVYSLASTVTHLAALGRRTPSGLTAAHLGSGTVSVSNVGAAGKGEGASPVLVPSGGLAIVALGRAEWIWDVSETYWDESRGLKGARRLRLPVSWTADHRVVEGAELAAFVEAWRAWVEAPARMIGEGL
ncbi:unnamed protein product [Mycena citricolor]|uniref:Dihydrolipoamide acetyltransferase component of pyruvate dehydrogenase complex n=1 Tax=Mycena citricolor TaxID=2018698 RepID=A0AAD2H4I8_9AGAR|nr:unnamed protein product [Mycena citricolor]